LDHKKGERKGNLLTRQAGESTYMRSILTKKKKWVKLVSSSGREEK